MLGMYSFHGRGTLNGTIPHPALVSLAKQAAAGAGLSLQRNAMVGLLTDSAYVQLVGAGIPVLDLGFRSGIRIPRSRSALSDLDGLYRLSWELIRSLTPGMNLARRY